MFGMLESLAKAAVAVVTVPVNLVVDVATLPSTAFDGKAPFGNTSEAIGDMVQNLKNATKPDKSS